MASASSPVMLGSLFFRASSEDIFECGGILPQKLVRYRRGYIPFGLLVMADTMTSDQRSRLMSRVRSRDTRLELRVRNRVWSDGFRYRLHVRALPGTPDLVLPKYRMAVFVHGCFWHQHTCPKSKRPASNRDFWDRKLDANIGRDTRILDELNRLGWIPFTIWECTLERDTDILLEALRSVRAELSVGPRRLHG